MNNWDSENLLFLPNARARARLETTALLLNSGSSGSYNPQNVLSTLELGEAEKPLARARTFLTLYYLINSGQMGILDIEVEVITHSL